MLVRSTLAVSLAFSGFVLYVVLRWARLVPDPLIDESES
jgi:hypothetical protein